MPEIGFVPPMARIKLHARAKKERIQSRRNVIFILILCMLIVLFTVYNVQYFRILSSTNRLEGHGISDILHESKLRGRPWISKDSLPFNQGSFASISHHLIVVAGHSVTVSGDLEDAGVDESDWFLLDYQKGQGLPEAIKAHIQAGIDEAALDPDSLLIFSGGETRAITGPLTEGASYFHAADAMRMWPARSTVRARTVTEEFATDSFENLMFSICRFKEVTGRYPTRISVVSFSFKRRRFESLHVPALGWPKDNFFYIGADPPASTGFNLEKATAGEQKNAASPFEKDPYGCFSDVLQKKRKERNPFFRTPPYPLSCPDMKNLLSYCGPEYFPRSLLPWGSLSRGTLEAL